MHKQGKGLNPIYGWHYKLDGRERRETNPGSSEYMPFVNIKQLPEFLNILDEIPSCVFFYTRDPRKDEPGDMGRHDEASSRSRLSGASLIEQNNLVMTLETGSVFK